MGNLTEKQRLKIKSSIMDTNNHLNEVHPSFNKELSPGFRLVDNFPNCFSFHIVNFNDTETISAYLQSLDNILEKSFLNLNIILIISNTSIKDNVATFISHILSSWSVLKKTIYYAVNIISTEAEMFLIRYGIN